MSSHWKIISKTYIQFFGCTAALIVKIIQKRWLLNPSEQPKLTKLQNLVTTLISVTVIFSFSCAGAITHHRLISDNGTHKIVSITAQILGYMATPDTKYLIQLRNPTDRWSARDRETERQRERERVGEREWERESGGERERESVCVCVRVCACVCVCVCV